LKDLLDWRNEAGKVFLRIEESDVWKPDPRRRSGLDV